MALEMGHPTRRTGRASSSITTTCCRSDDADADADADEEAAAARWG